MTARLAALAFACLLGSSAYAQQTTNAPAVKPETEPQPMEEETVLLPEIVVTGRSDSQVGIADSASQGNVGQEQLELRPIIRPGEVLETVPGLIVSQHSGEGKANQYYLRGFNLDHGTDFLTQVDGVPVNLVSHAHGQGYTDTGFLIPELVRTLGYQKGVYYAENGDFSSAGAANIQYGSSGQFVGGSEPVRAWAPVDLWITSLLPTGSTGQAGDLWTTSLLPTDPQPYRDCDDRKARGPGGSV